jgi:hypothetical protein
VHVIVGVAAMVVVGELVEVGDDEGVEVIVNVLVLLCDEKNRLEVVSVTDCVSVLIEVTDGVIVKDVCRLMVKVKVVVCDGD